MKEFPILYKKTSVGKIQIWRVWTEENTIYSESGQLEGKKILSFDTIKEGKNIGKVNETTPVEQAEAEALSRWTMKKKKGYVETINDAKNDIVDEIIEGGFNPTLAKKYDEQKNHIVFPCAGQPKLDGIRSGYTGGDVMWSRTRKPIISVPHIPKALQDIGWEISDGELYNHSLKDDFEKITHIVNQKKKPDPEHEIVEYHVYDIPSKKPFRERLLDLVELSKRLPEDSPIKVVHTTILESEEDLMSYMEECLEAGYEGAMVRNLDDNGYEYKRSKHLQKVKTFDDEEFEIVGVEEGRGKLAGHAGSFICRTEEGNEFKAKLKGKLSDLRQYLSSFEAYKGKMLTVQFQGKTNKSNVPRFPVGLRIREEE